MRITLFSLRCSLTPNTATIKDMTSPLPPFLCQTLRMGSSVFSVENETDIALDNASNRNVWKVDERMVIHLCDPSDSS